MKGARQRLDDQGVRKRSAAFPFELAYRLINMFSVKGDLILDPFLGTGTSMAAAMASCRNSVGYEIDPNFSDALIARTTDIVEFSNQYIDERLARHIEFVRARTAVKGALKYRNKNYGFPVMTRQELEILVNGLREIRKLSSREFEMRYDPNPQEKYCGVWNLLNKEIFESTNEKPEPIQEDEGAKLAVDKPSLQQTLF